MSGSVLSGLKSLAFPIKHVLRVNDFKDIPGKACLNGVDNNDAFVNVGN